MDNLFCKSLPTLQFVKSNSDQNLDFYQVSRHKNDEYDFDYHELNINRQYDLQNLTAHPPPVCDYSQN